MTSELQHYIEGWLHKADNDVASAKRLIEIEPAILDNACFHCQQAIEKFIKAYLIFNGIDIQRTHNIIFLLSEAAKFDSVFGDIETHDINTYAVQGRYPDMSVIPELEEAKTYYELALEIKELVTSRIKFS
ncbi:MAG: HEPN domain-containing protein [Sphingobacteriales bacterium]|nr:MAG: HEPN domain-containing protein [Sphingobacteriales bacterium]